MLKKLKDNVSFILILVLSILIPLTFHPRFIDIGTAANVGRGGILYPFIIADFLALFVLNVGKFEWIRNKDIRVIIISLLVTSVLSTTLIFIDNNSLFGEIRSIAICLFAMIIGWQINLSKGQFLTLFLLFGITVLYVGYLQIFIRGNGLEIGQYFADQKNALGPLVATVGILSFYFSSEKNISSFLKIICIVILIIAFVIILTIRARAALLTLTLLVIVLILKRFQNKRNIFISIMVVIILFAFAFVVLPDTVKQYIYDSIFYGTDDGDITSGRADRNLDALNIIIANPLFGNIYHQYKIDLVHNYFLIILVNYGLFFGLPLIVLYLYLFFKNIRKTIIIKQLDISDIGFFVILIPFIVSLFEYTFPYGPGTATVMNFIFYGMTLKNRSPSYNQAGHSL